MSNIIPFQEVERMATSMVKSGFFGAVKTTDQALVLLMIAQSDGIHPMRAIAEYDVIGGKPSLKATAVLSRFQQSGGSIKWIETNDKKAVAKFSHPQGGEITITWDMARAAKAQLLKNDTWTKFPDQMLRARCIPEGVRAIFPSCLSGMYTSDEVRDFAPDAVHEVQAIEVSIEPNLKDEKSRLQRKLRDLQLSTADIKAFASYYNIGEDIEAIMELNENEAALIERVKEFESNSQNQG